MIMMMMMIRVEHSVTGMWVGYDCNDDFDEDIMV